MPLIPFWYGPLLLACGLLLAQVPVETGAAAQGEDYAIKWRPDPAETGKFILEVRGLNGATLKELRQSNWGLTAWQRLLSVYVREQGTSFNAEVPPVLGTYRLDGDFVSFRPQYPLVARVEYLSILDPNRFPGSNETGKRILTNLFVLPSQSPLRTTILSHVYPSASLLPENLLKFYLHFSAPMSRGHIYDYIHLRDEQGKEVELPFLELQEELWNADMTRLTLFIDPGRIKRGVRPLEEIGPALQEGKRYTLLIGPEWKDGTGNSLTQEFRKMFKVGPPDREPLDPSKWKIREPKSGTRSPVILQFPGSVDHALALRMIHVTTASGRIIPGQPALEDEERRWSFKPQAPWSAGSLSLLVETTLEDMAGNNIGKPFEVDLFEGTIDHITNSTIKLPFQAR